ncbi:MAG: LCP family protein [Cyanobacteria bacterium]|nr:LCP family protein [Cyanobacteriota bacterium]
MPAPSQRATRRLPQLTAARLISGALVLSGAIVGTMALGLLWHPQDKAFQPKAELTPASLAEKPRRPITLLVIGSDSDHLGDASNGAAPAGPANADAMLLIRIDSKGPLQVLNLPRELAVTIPGSSQPLPLGDLYRRGGVALTAGAVRELTGLQPPRPDRYLVLPRSALRDLINGLGGLELDPPRTMRYQDKAQKLKIDLQGGLQQLGGAQVEQLVRFQDKGLGEAGRRLDHQLVETALHERLREPEQLAKLAYLVQMLQGKVDTNLSPRETLSLLAAGLDGDRPIQFASLPLDPAKPSHGKLRQLSRTAPQPLWNDN